MDLISKRLIYFIVSILIIVAGGVAQLASPDLRLGIEFSSGVIVNAGFEQAVTEDQVRQTVTALGYDEVVVQKTGEGNFFIRVRSSDDLNAQRTEIEKAMTNAYGVPKTFEFTAVSPIIAQEAIVAGGFSVLAASVGILLYIAWAFRKVPKPFRYGVAAVIALVHDVLMTLAVSAIAAKFFPIEISSMYLVALLTLLGYSVNDTIVVFDRLRENILRGGLRDFPSQVNYSLLETMTRSLNTSLAVFLVLVGLLILGPVTTRDFVFALTVGVISGSYSSIFIAAQILVTWEQRSWGKVELSSAPAGAPARGT